MDRAIRLQNDYENAMHDLSQLGTVLTSTIEVPQGTFTRVSIIINNEKHYADHADQRIATIQLRNQLMN